VISVSVRLLARDSALLKNGRRREELSRRCEEVIRRSHVQYNVSGLSVTSFDVTVL